jgi:hypothetical protein
MGGPRGREGFILVLTLLLMALVVMTVVLLAGQLRLAIAVAEQRSRLAVERETARVALAEALGDLQRRAGPDRRVTARAEILGGGLPEERRDWTGVWSTVAGSAVASWLVSGIGAPDPRSDPGPTFRLAGAPLDPASTPPVEVGAVSVSGEGGGKERAMGWWVGDLGVAANLADADPTLEGSGREDWLPGLPEWQRARLGQLVSAGMAGDFLLTGEDGRPQLRFGTAEDREVREQVAADLSAYRWAGYGDREQLGGLFHDLTPVSYGVLADVTAGGLRRDLSAAPGLLGPAVEAFLGLEYLVQPGRAGGVVAEEEDRRRSLRMVPPVPAPSGATGYPEGTPVFSVLPVLTDLAVHWGIAPEDGAGSPVESHLRMFTEFWNPYTAPLLHRELEVAIEGFPALTVLHQTVDQAPLGESRLPLGEWYGDPFTVRYGHRIQRSSPYAHQPAGNGNSFDERALGPGRFLYYGGPDNEGTNDEVGTDHAFFHVKDASRSRWQESRSGVRFPASPDLDEQEMRFRAEALDLGIDLRWAADGRSLVRWEEVLFDPMDTGWKPDLRDWEGANNFGFQIRLKERGHLAEDPAAWLAGASVQDPRTPRPTFGADGRYLPNSTHGLRPDRYRGAPETNHPTRTAEDPGFLLNRTWASSRSLEAISNRADKPLFELPQQPILSLGSLQHLQVAGRPPYAVGNPWGGELNRWFDRFFVSGMQAGWTEPGGPLAGVVPHPRLVQWSLPGAPLSRPVAREAGVDRAAHLLVRAPLNFHSTSEEAWVALLSSTSLGYRQQKDGTPLPWEVRTPYPNLLAERRPAAGEREVRRIPYAFTRFPQTLAQVEDFRRAESEDPNGGAPWQFFRDAATSLVPRTDARAGPGAWDRDDDRILRAIAAEIVDRLRQRGAPYRSWEEFLGPDPVFGGRSLLEAALEGAAAQLDAEAAGAEPSASFYRDPVFPASRIDARTPAYLAQADLLNALAPALAPRSDTFRIRATAGRMPGDGETRVGAYLVEALVQRIPVPVGLLRKDAPTAAEVARGDPAWPGRAFRVLQFRVLPRGSD